IHATYTRACTVARVPQIYKWRPGTGAPAVKNMKENVHNFCLDPAPSFCPAGEYDCQMYGFGNYSCNCAAGFYYNDERCGNVVCPEHTECRPKDDIDECASNPCQTEAECLNTPGSYVCARDAENAVCPNGTTVVVTGPFSYRCECSWIYAGSNCRFPLTLILLILACFFLLTTIGAILFAVCQKRRNRTGT
ncbi:hypothetical protein TELCIR_18890, partial [Teladorsagia circumcincta]